MKKTVCINPFLHVDEHKLEIRAQVKGKETTIKSIPFYNNKTKRKKSIKECFALLGFNI